MYTCIHAYNFIDAYRDRRRIEVRRGRCEEADAKRQTRLGRRACWLEERNTNLEQI